MQEQKLFFAGLLGLLVGGTLTFWIIGNSVFFSWDSANYIAFANESIQSGEPFRVDLSYNQSLGNIGYPLDFRLAPEFITSILLGEVEPTLFYLTVTTLFYVSAYFTFVVFGFKKNIAVLAAVAFSFLTLPYTFPPILTELFWWHAPFMIPFVYVGPVLTIPFFFAGKLDPVRNSFLALIQIAVSIWVIGTFSKGAAIMLVTASVFCLAFLILSESWKEFFWKIGIAISAVVALFLFGPMEYITGLYSGMGNFLGKSNITEANTIDINAVISTLFVTPVSLMALIIPNLVWVKYFLGYGFPIISLVGILFVLGLKKYGRREKMLAGIFLFMYPFSFLAVYATAHIAQIYSLFFLFSVVAALELSRIAIGFYQKGVAWGNFGDLFVGALRWIAKANWHDRLSNFITRCFRPYVRGVYQNRLGICVRQLTANLVHLSQGAFVRWLALDGPNRQAVALLVLIPSFAFVSLIAGLISGVPSGYSFRPAPVKISEFLVDKISFPHNASFNGRFLSMFLNDEIAKPDFQGMPASQATTASALIRSSIYLANTEGNDLFAGLRNMNVPVTLEANRASTPLSALFHNYLLVRDGDIERIDYRTITKAEGRLLALIGVRYLATHENLESDPWFARTNQNLFSKHSDAVLYELKDVNIGQYSPTELSYSSSFVETLKALEEPDFDPRVRAFVHEDLGIDVSNLVSAESVEVTRIANGIQVEARAEGASVLILPFEFSRCFNANTIGASKPVRIFRTNVMLTGVYFEHETSFDLKFDYGVLVNTGCRLRDINDTRSLGVSISEIEKLRSGKNTTLNFTGYM